jgi:tripartite-type tricarboxylate transporter receptor subunit TctC
MIESGFAGFAFPSWYAIYAPVGTPTDVIKRLDDAFRAVLQDSATLSVLTANGTDSLYAGPDGLAQFTASEIERYRKVLADAHVEKVNN